MIGRIISNYKIIAVIGEGAMSTVYLAEHIHIHRKAAIKSLHSKLLVNQNIRERFKNEAATLSQIEHPNIVKLYDYLETENGFYLIMEYVDGVTLDEFIKKESGPIKEENAIKIMNQLLFAFTYAHSKNIVHRDVKPSNIIIKRDFSIVKILDFGIAKIMSEDSRNLTRDGTHMGTVYYMSPEQVKGLKLDKRSDIYSLGVTLFQMVTGTNPYAAITTEYEIYNHITQKELPNARSVYPYVSDGMVAIIKKATQKDPAKRYQDCSQIITDLDLLAKNAHPKRQQAKYKNKLTYITAASLLILIVTGATIIFLTNIKSTQLQKKQNKNIWQNAVWMHVFMDSAVFNIDTSDNVAYHSNTSFLNFGDSVQCLKNKYSQNKIKAKYNSEKGFIDTNVLIDNNDFRLLSNILTNDSMKRDINQLKYRRSLVAFYKEHHIYPDTFAIAKRRDANNRYIFIGKNDTFKTDYCLILLNNRKELLLFVYEKNIQQVGSKYETDQKHQSEIDNILLGYHLKL